jgi:hypothetical protein
VGRPACCFSDCPSHRLGGSGSHARETLWLLLVPPRVHPICHNVAHGCYRLSRRNHHLP